MAMGAFKSMQAASKVHLEQHCFISSLSSRVTFMWLIFLFPNTFTRAFIMYVGATKHKGCALRALCCLFIAGWHACLKGRQLEQITFARRESHVQGNSDRHCCIIDRQLPT